MEYVKLGNTGLDVSRICLGTMGFGDAKRWYHKWVLDEENSRPIIKQALELGINFFDTANMYADGTSEAFLGRALRAGLMQNVDNCDAQIVPDAQTGILPQKSKSRSIIRY